MKRYAAEAIGTFALVFCGTGAIIVNQQSGGVIGHAGIAATFGVDCNCDDLHLRWHQRSAF